MSTARRGPPIVEATLLIAVVFGLVLAAGIIGGPTASLPVVQLLAVGAPVLIYAMVHPTDARSLLGLERPRALAVAGGLVAGTGVLMLNIGAIVPLTFHMFGEPATPPPIILERSIAWQLLAVAAIPAVCEELAFRGVLMRSLARRSAALGVFGSAAVFAVFHMSLHRMGPTFAVGAVAGLALLWGGSTWVAVAVHLANNAVLIALVALAGPGMSWHPAMLAGSGCLLIAGGCWLIRRATVQ